MLDNYGSEYFTEDELCDLLYKDPRINIHDLPTQCPTVSEFNKSAKKFHISTPMLRQAQQYDITVEEYDRLLQNNWFMPKEYKELDIAKWVLDQCKTDAELQRCGEELLMFVDRNLLDLLRFMKYFVDHMRANNLVWGVGRGSSVASYVLYLIGVHKVNSMFYDLDITEFLK